MTPEQLDKARWAEACRRQDGNGYARKTQEYRELVVSNWTRPAPISPRLRAAREHAEKHWNSTCERKASEVDFLAGVAWAVEKAEPVVTAMGLPDEGYIFTPGWQIRKVIQTYRQEIRETPHEGQ